MHNWLLAVGVILAIFGCVEMLLSYRSAQMRALATRLGWTYTPGRNHVWRLIFKQQVFPVDFRLRGYPFTARWGMMNILRGKCDGTQMLVLDELLHLGPRYDRYVTFIAAKTDTDPFVARTGKEKVAHSNGWCAVYKMRYSLLPWSMSVQRIEEHLATLCGNPQAQS